MSTSSPVRGLVYLLKTGAAAQTLTFLSVILVMYKYDPGSFGVFTLIVSLATLISAVSALRIERALVVESDARIPRLLGICIALTVLSAGLCLLILGAALMVQDMAASLLSLPAGLGAFYCLLTGTGQVLSHMAIRDRRLPLIGISELLFAITLVALIWLLDPGESGSTTLLGIYTAARLLSLASYLRLDLTKWRSSGGEAMPIAELLKYVSSVFTTLLSNLQFRGIYYLSGLYFGSAVTGGIALAHRIMYAPINLIGSAMRRAYFREFTRDGDAGLIRSHVRKVLTYGSILSAVLLPVVRLLLDQFGFLIPEKWAELPGYLLILYPAASILVLLSWLDRVYDAQGKQHLALRYEAAYTTMLYLALAVLLAGTSPMTFLTAYTLITVTYNVIWAWLTLRMLGVASGATMVLGICHAISCAQVIPF